MFCFFFNDTATTEIYTLSLHDALPIYRTDQNGTITIRSPGTRGGGYSVRVARGTASASGPSDRASRQEDRKSTRLNSSHANISYAVFCLKKKKTNVCLQLRCYRACKPQ